tara:strand:- start:708 stop:1028 length:321 start_codon:yes stop_codon:yes gene_type:complete
VSLDDPRYQVQAVLDLGSAALEVLTLVALGDLVGAQALGGIEGVSQRGDAFGVERLELIDHLQDPAEIVVIVGCVILRKVDPGQVSGTEDLGVFKRHDQFLDGRGP